MMKIILYVAHFVTIDDDDVEKIEAGEMDLDDIDWSYYVNKFPECELESIDAF